MDNEEQDVARARNVIEVVLKNLPGHERSVMLVVGGAVLWGTVVTMDEYMRGHRIPIADDTPVDPSVVFLKDVRILTGNHRVESARMIVPLASIDGFDFGSPT